MGSNPDVSSSASINSLLQKAGFSRDQLSQFARGNDGVSSGSLTNLVQRQNSFDALMSLDFQSLQSIDNLANLIQSGGSSGAAVPEAGLKNADFGLDALTHAQRRLASAASTSRMESLLRNLHSNNDNNNNASSLHNHNNSNNSSNNSSSNNMNNHSDGFSNANLSSLWQSMQLQQQRNAGGGNGSAAQLQQLQQQTSASNFFAQAAAAVGGSSSHGNNNSASSSVSLANLLRQDSATGLSALRGMSGDHRNSTSVDDFLSLVAAGDIPHQDPALLNIPLAAMQQQQQQQQNDNTAKILLAQAQQQHQQQMQLLNLQQQQQSPSNAALANALASRSDAAQSSHRKRAAQDVLGDPPAHPNKQR